MGNRELKKFLEQSLGGEMQPDVSVERLEETIKLCTGILEKQKSKRPEARTDFFTFLSDVFRFEGISILAMQALTLFTVCLAVSTVARHPRFIPAFTPLFVLAVLPVIFKSQYCNMSEMEAVTRASGAQIILAKLILAGGVNLVCLTVFLGLERGLQNAGEQTGQIVLYCLVPYLVSMVIMLRFLRSRRAESMTICAVSVAGLGICLGMTAKIAPWLYETSATGIWIVAFGVFAGFFAREIYYIAKATTGRTMPCWG